MNGGWGLEIGGWGLVNWSPRHRVGGTRFRVLTRGLVIRGWGMVPALAGRAYARIGYWAPQLRDALSRGLVIGAVAWGPGAAHHLSGGTIECRFARSLQNN